MIPKFIIIHHSASDRDTTGVMAIDSWHRFRWPNFKSSLGYWVGYHFVITANGTITQCRRENEEGAHTLGGYNQKSIGICLTGNFETEQPTPAQLTSLQTLLDKVKKEYQIVDSNIKGHRQVWPTLCPGRNLQNWLEKYLQLSWLQREIARLKELLIKLTS